MKDSLRAGAAVILIIFFFLEAWSLVTPLPSKHFKECSAKAAPLFGSKDYPLGVRLACGTTDDPGSDLITVLWDSL